MSDADLRTSDGSRGDRRGQDRRRGDRRRTDRRSPLPLWRQPAAFVGYGVAGALVLVLLFQGIGRSGEEPVVATAPEQTSGAQQPTLPAVREGTGTVREAFSVADFETLIAEGDRATGQIVRAELFCGPLSSRTIRDVENTNASLLALVDADGRVGAAECRWGSEGRTEDFLLIVPPTLATEFAQAPEVELNFVTRRRITAHIEWLGRSEALALRYGGVLREIVS